MLRSEKILEIQKKILDLNHCAQKTKIPQNKIKNQTQIFVLESQTQIWAWVGFDIVLESLWVHRLRCGFVGVCGLGEVGRCRRADGVLGSMTKADEQLRSATDRVEGDEVGWPDPVEGGELGEIR